MNNKSVISKTNGNSDIPFNFGEFDIFSPSSNQSLKKMDDGSIYGVRYVVSTEPSSLRPVRGWTIRIETFLCDNLANIESEDVLFMRLLKKSNPSLFESDYVLDRIEVKSENKPVHQNNNRFNAMMATTLMMSQIDAKKTPDVYQVLSQFNLLD